MPALLGYMVAIVVTLGGYMVGLHWLLTPPDPFMPDTRSQHLATSLATSHGGKHETGKQKSRLAAMAPSAAAAETPPAPVPSIASANDSMASAEARSSPADPPASEGARSENNQSKNDQPLPSPAPAAPTPTAAVAPAVAPPAAGNAPSVERRLAEASSSTHRGSNQDKRATTRKRLAEGRQLQVMILRTYQGADGRRFTRLIPLREAERNDSTRQVALGQVEFESNPFGFW